MFTELVGNMTAAIEHVTLFPTRCLRNRYRSSRCRHCADGCPEQAISFQPTVTIANEQCSGCLSCVASCPTEALVPNSSTCRFRETVIKPQKKKILFSCKINPYAQADIRVECLAVLSIIDLAALVIAVDTIELHLGYCSTCPRAKAIPFLQDRVKHVSEITHLFTGKGIKFIKDSDGQNNPLLKRRAYFKSFKRAFCDSIAGLTERQHGIQVKSKKHIPERLHFLRQSLETKEKKIQKEAKANLLFFLALDKKCNHCGLCAAACPTGALTCKRKQGKILRFVRDACSGCGLCAELCPVAALSITS